MAHVSVPHVWVPGEILTAADLNALVAAIIAQVNGNLDNSNLAPLAAIQGSKLADAPNGITTGKINDQAVTSLKIADGTIVAGDIAPGTITTDRFAPSAIVRSVVSAVFTDRSASPVTLPAQIVCQLPDFTSFGGKVLFIGSSSFSVTMTGGATGVVTWTLNREGISPVVAPATILSWPMVIDNGVGNFNITYPLFTPQFIDMPPAGVQRYWLSLAVTGGQATNTSGNEGVYTALELPA